MSIRSNTCKVDSQGQNHKINNKQKDRVQQISYQHTLKVLNKHMGIVFYDVTTLYFEIDDQDDLRRTGFSNEDRHQNPQIVLGLLVSVGGYPLAYDVFEGNKYEGHTMLPVIDAFKKKYELEKLVVIADSGLLSNDNIEDLQQGGYEYILGARIKNEKLPLRKQILALKLDNGESVVLKKDVHASLVISYSLSRAKKDQANRAKGLEKLEKQIKAGRLTKSNINNRGYNKYLKLEGELKVQIDREKFQILKLGVPVRKTGEPAKVGRFEMARSSPVRTPDFHSGNRGSIPLRATISSKK